MVDETRELDSCDNSTRLPHGALVWWHERDGLMDPCAVFLKEQVEPVHEAIDAHLLGALSFLFQTFEHRQSDLMILNEPMPLLSFCNGFFPRPSSLDKGGIRLLKCSALYSRHAVTRKKCHVKFSLFGLTSGKLTWQA